MKITKKYDFKFILEVGRSSLQGGTENLDDTVFVLSLFWQYKFRLFVGKTFFLEKALYPPSVSCISVIGVWNVHGWKRMSVS